MDRLLDARIHARGKEIFNLIGAGLPYLFERHNWIGRMLERAVIDNPFRKALFRFAEAAPALQSAESLQSHVAEYFSYNDQNIARLLRGGGGGLAGVFGSKNPSRALKANLENTLRHFLAGESLGEAASSLEAIRSGKFGFMLGLAGIRPVSEAECDEIARSFLLLPQELSKLSQNWRGHPLAATGLRTDPDADPTLDWGSQPMAQISLKPSYFYSQARPEAFEDSVAIILARLRPVLRRAISTGCLICLEMEEYRYREITIEVYKRLRSDPEFVSWPHLCLTLQAYLKDTEGDILALLDWAGKKNLTLNLRLVKGRHLADELALAGQEGRVAPVWPSARLTDAAFERAARLILMHHEKALFTAATHNVRSLAAVLETAREVGAPRQRYEFQFIHGLAEPVQRAVFQEHGRVRSVCSFGGLDDFTPDFLRVLKDASSPDSFLFKYFAQGVSQDELLRNPLDEPDLIALAQAVNFYASLGPVQAPALAGAQAGLPASSPTPGPALPEAESLSPGAANPAEEAAQHTLLGRPLDGTSNADQGAQPESGAVFEYIDGEVRREAGAPGAEAAATANQDAMEQDAAGQGATVIEAGPVQAAAPSGADPAAVPAAPAAMPAVQARQEAAAPDGQLAVSGGALPAFPVPPRARTLPVSSLIDEAPLRLPMPDFTKAEVRQAFKDALARQRSGFGKTLQLFIAGQEYFTPNVLASLNPASSKTSPDAAPDEVIANICQAGKEEIDLAVAAANSALPEWRDTPADLRAQILRQASALGQERIYDLCALEILETGASWAEAWADVAQGLDYLECYARHMLEVAATAARYGAPGEINRMIFQPKGVAAVITPFSSPVSSALGFLGAALAAGNTAVFKPASLAPALGHAVTDLFREGAARSGLRLPEGALNFCPGKGAVVGDHLVMHPAVDLVCFCGSTPNGLRIRQKAVFVPPLKPRELMPNDLKFKNVVAMMSGKNSVIVDEDADQDLAIRQILHSAFANQGQRAGACSRVIVLDSIFEEFSARLVQGARSLKAGPAEDPASFFGPLAQQCQADKSLRYIHLAEREGHILLKRDDYPAQGAYVPLTIIEIVHPGGHLSREEIFGPVLALYRASSFERALDLAKDSPFNLCGAVFSRSPSNLARAARVFGASQLSLNRLDRYNHFTRQPWGGFGLSGNTPKTGTREFFLQFMDSRCVSEDELWID